MTRELTVALIVTCRSDGEAAMAPHVAALVEAWAQRAQTKAGTWPQAEEFIAHAPEGIHITMQAAWLNEVDPA